MLFGGGGSAATSTAGNGLRTETGGFGDPNLETCSSNYENGGGLCNGGGGGPGGGPGGGTSFRRSFRTKATYVLRPETVRQMVVITTTTSKNGKRSGSASAPLADLKLLQQNGTGNGCRKNLVGTLSTEFYNRKDSGGGGGGNPRGLRLTSSE